MTPTPPEPIEVVVLDTNIALDLFVFDDPATAPLRAALQAGRCRWVVTGAMRDELQRVLGYAHIAQRLQQRERPAPGVLAAFDGCVQAVDAAPRAPFACKDADDQKFIDLAVAHRATLASKDAAVLCMARRLARVGVRVCRDWAPAAPEVAA